MLYLESILALFASLFLLVPFCYLPASYAMFVVKERVIKHKHLLLVSGTRVHIYWLATYTFDMFQFFFVAVASMMVFLAYGDNIFVENTDSALGAFVLLLMYGFSSIPLSYLYSFYFQNHSTAQIGIATANFVTGWVFVVADVILNVTEKTKEVNQDLRNIYRLFPHYNLGDGLLRLTTKSFVSKVTADDSESVFDYKYLGQPMFYMLIEGVAYFLLVLIYERFSITQFSDILRTAFNNTRIFLGGLCYTLRSTQPAAPLVEGEEDQDVAAEREYVQSGAAMSDPDTVLCVDGLRKVYPGGAMRPPKVAVQGMHVSVKKGMCFGLLGVNGAGKTTTLAMLTGEEAPTSGNAWVNGYSIVDDMERVRQGVGFCPQFDALLDNMTGREHLRMFARTKGLAECHVEVVAEQLLQLVNLSKFADKISGAYSGGNKRKLSLAIALIGNPQLVILDEPSTGMDPVSRRFMWDVIEATARERSVVLTTHSLDECEALCNQVVVMVGGKLRCLGNIQHLKSRFGMGYTVEIKTGPDGVMEQLEEFVRVMLQGSVTESHQTWFKCKIPQDALGLAKIFRTIEDHREELRIQDYSVSQTTLEQIFLHFAKDQAEETALAPGMRESAEPGKEN